MSERIRGGAPLAIAMLALCLPAGSAGAQNVSVSPDVHVDLAGTVFADEAVAVDVGLGVVVPASLGSLPESAAVNAYDVLDGGEQLFALDTTVELPGPLVVEQRDVARWDGAAYTLEFDGSAAGVPDGAAVDGVTTTNGLLLLSFDTTVSLAGGVVAADEDVVGWDGASFWLALDSSAAGAPEAADADGIYAPPDGNGMLSFDIGGSFGAVAFADEDVLRLDFVTSAWTLEYDGSAQHAALAPADIEAIYLPEPGRIPMLASGIAFLLGLLRRREPGPPIEP
jgi:hypothetical protein